MDQLLFKLQAFDNKHTETMQETWGKTLVLALF